MRGGDISFPDIQLVAWKFIEDRPHHRYFPVYFLKSFISPTQTCRITDHLPVKLLFPLRGTTLCTQIVMYCLLQLVMMPIIVNKVYSTIILAFGYHENFLMLFPSWKYFPTSKHIRSQLWT